ncbi:DedA family protein [Sphingomonas sp.]|uniref:DedA family protein n=1 Tax=Sphingomonas sp. TaxID=28214 RepID=UPI00286CFBD5|nr:DedA family protein [Sphingomonas sp.]
MMSDWVIRLIEQAGYLGVAFLMFLETLFPPIPSEVIMPVAGVAAAKGKLSLGWVIASGTAGAMLGNIVWYLAARALGIIRLKPFILRWGRWLTIEWDEIVRAERWFGTRGWLIVGVGRLLPTVRSIVSVPAGLLKMRFLTFTIASSVGTALWTALLAGAGYLMGARYHDIDRVIGPVANGVIVAILALYAVRLWRGRKVVASFD